MSNHVKSLCLLVTSLSLFVIYILKSCKIPKLGGSSHLLGYIPGSFYGISKLSPLKKLGWTFTTYDPWIVHHHDGCSPFPDENHDENPGEKDGYSKLRIFGIFGSSYMRKPEQFFLGVFFWNIWFFEDFWNLFDDGVSWLRVLCITFIRTFSLEYDGIWFSWYVLMFGTRWVPETQPTQASIFLQWGYPESSPNRSIYTNIILYHTYNIHIQCWAP